MWYQNIRSALFSFVTIHASAGQTDGQTDRQTELRQQYRALHYMQSHGTNYIFKFMIGWFNVLGTVTPKRIHLFPAASVFFQFHWEERWGMDKCKLGVISHERLKIDIKLLSIANRKSYIPRRLHGNG